MDQDNTNTVGRPARKDKDNKAAPSVERGTKPGEKRKTYIVNIALADKVEAIAEQRNVPVKNVVNEFFKYMVQQYEKMHGPLPAPGGSENTNDGT